MQPANTNNQGDANMHLPAKQGPGTMPALWTGVHAENEIDLVDMGVMLLRHWRLMLVVFLSVVILASLFAIIRKTSYEYTTNVRLGSLLSQTGNVVPLMPGTNVAQVLKNYYIPAAINQYAGQNPSAAPILRAIKINADGGNNSAIVTLTCKTDAAVAPSCVAVEKLAAEAFIQANSQFASTAQDQLARLQSRANVLRVQLTKLNASASLYRRQIAQAEKQIERMENAGLAAARSASAPTTGLSNLILATEVQQAMDNLNNERQQLYVTIPQQIAATSEQLADNQKAQQLQQQVIGQGYPDILSAGVRSLKPAGPSRIVIVMLGIIIGLFLAIFSALFVNYVKRVRERLALTQSEKQ